MSHVGEPTGIGRASGCTVPCTALSGFPSVDRHICEYSYKTKKQQQHSSSSSRQHHYQHPPAAPRTRPQQRAQRTASVSFELFFGCFSQTICWTSMPTTRFWKAFFKTEINAPVMTGGVFTLVLQNTAHTTLSAGFVGRAQFSRPPFRRGSAGGEEGSMPRGQLLCTIQFVQKRRKARFRTTAEKHRFRDGLVKAVPCPVRTAVERSADCLLPRCRLPFLFSTHFLFLVLWRLSLACCKEPACL